MKSRKCTSCLKIKNLSEFYLDKRFNIPRSRCKSCNLSYNQKRRIEGYRHPETKARKESRLRWEQKNPEKKREINRKSRIKNRDKRNQERRKNGIRYEQVVSYVHTRRAKISNCPDKHSANEWAFTKALYGHQCLRCGISANIVRDHVIPLSKGGGNGIDNLQPLCRSCNAKKHISSFDYRPIYSVFWAGSGVIC